ncbi:unnamed protein product [Lota lota]
MLNHSMFVYLDCILIFSGSLEEHKHEAPGVSTQWSPTGAPAECPSQPSWSFREVLQRNQALLRGKLDRLAIALQNTTCLHRSTSSS